MPPRRKRIAPLRYDQRPETRAFIAELVAEHGFARRELAHLFAHARYQPRIVAAMSRPVLSPPKWYEYAPQFLSRERIDGGLEFWRAQRGNTCARAKRIRRSGRGDRRDHRRRNLLWPQYRQLPGVRRADDARLRLSAPQRIFPERAQAVSAARARPGHLAAACPRDRTPAHRACRNSCPAASAPTPSTTTAMAGSTCRPNRPTRSAASPTIWRGTIGSRAHRCCPGARSIRRRARPCCASSTAASASGGRSTPGRATASAPTPCPPIPAPTRSAC